MPAWPVAVLVVVVGGGAVEVVVVLVGGGAVVEVVVELEGASVVDVVEAGGDGMGMVQAASAQSPGCTARTS